jgi:hypothetical protein
MNTSSPDPISPTPPAIDPRPRYFSRAYFRVVVKSFAADWKSTKAPMRLYIVGIGLISIGGLIARPSVPLAWIQGTLLLGAVLASLGFAIEVYPYVDHWSEKKPVKLLGLLGLAIGIAFSTALSSVIINEATGLNPGDFPLAVAFVAPFTAGYIASLLALMAVISGMAWFFSVMAADMLKTVWASSTGEKYELAHPALVGLRFAAVFVMLSLWIVVTTEGKRPYASFLSGTARNFVFYLEMYDNDPCRLPNGRVRRLNDALVADGIVEGRHTRFQVRVCPLQPGPRGVLPR